MVSVEVGQGANELLDEVGSRYFDHLIVVRKHAETAYLCPKGLSDGQYKKAFSLYYDLMKSDVFDFIQNKNLHDAIHENVEIYREYDQKMLPPFFGAVNITHLEGYLS